MRVRKFSESGAWMQKDTNRLESAYQALAAYDDDDALLALEAIEDKRRTSHYAKYWASEPDEKYSIFYESIESDFRKLTSDIKIFGLLGGNRSSKTERGAFLAVAWLLGKEYFRDEPSWRYVKDLPIPEHGVNIWAVGLDFSVIRDVIWGEKLRRGHRHPGLLPQTPCAIVTRVSDSEFQVTVDVGGRKSSLTCKSADSGREKMQSASVDLVWIDEECEVEVYDELYQRTVDCGGKIVLTLTPLSDVGAAAKRPWVYDLHKEFKSGRKDLVFIQLSALDNPFIPEEEKVMLKQKWAGHPEERARLYGDFIQRSGLVYPMWNREKHFIKRQTLPHDWRRIVSIDPAATGITAVIWACINPKGDVYVYRVYYERDLTVADHCRNIIARTGGEKIDTWIIDPYWGVARNAETHKQGYQLYRENGCPVRVAPRAEDFGRETMAQYLQATLEPTSRNPKLYIFNDLTVLAEEIESYIWDSYSKGALKGQSKEKPMKRNDHAVNALQYLLSLRPKPRLGGSLAGFERNANSSYT